MVLEMKIVFANPIFCRIYITISSLHYPLPVLMHLYWRRFAFRTRSYSRQHTKTASDTGGSLSRAVIMAFADLALTLKAI